MLTSSWVFDLMVAQGLHLERYQSRNEPCCRKHQVSTVLIDLFLWLWLALLPHVRGCVFALNPIEFSFILEDYLVCSLTKLSRLLLPMESLTKIRTFSLNIQYIYTEPLLLTIFVLKYYTILFFKLWMFNLLYHNRCYSWKRIPWWYLRPIYQEFLWLCPDNLDF